MNPMAITINRGNIMSIAGNFLCIVLLWGPVASSWCGVCLIERYITRARLSDLLRFSWFVIFWGFLCFWLLGMINAIGFDALNQSELR
jgi:hypothetical protein